MAGYGGAPGVKRTPLTPYRVRYKVAFHRRRQGCAAGHAACALLENALCFPAVLPTIGSIFVFDVFKRSGHKTFGLINCLNNRGLGTESRILIDLFKRHLPDYTPSLYKVRAGSTLRDFDSTWQDDRRFLKWLHRQQTVMTIETFMPNLFRYCKEHGIKTIWRPNQEIIAADVNVAELQLVDCIMCPQHACAALLKRQFGIDQNVVVNPWVMSLPVEHKALAQGPTRFLFNAGRLGIGDRRNGRVVIDAFAKVLAEHDDIHFTFKTQKGMDVTPLLPYKGTRFEYICRNTRYSKNLEFYRRADFSVAPSKWEGLGFALLESLYCGTPVLSVDSPPMNEWVRHKSTGYLTPVLPNNAQVPVPHDRDNPDPDGLNWVLSARCSRDDLAEGIVWLSQNKQSLYQQFHQVNADQLERRLEAFVATFAKVLD